MKDFSPTREGTLLAESLIPSGTFPVWGRGGKIDLQAFVFSPSDHWRFMWIPEVSRLLDGE
jgi:hypothetical protein